MTHDEVLEFIEGGKVRAKERGDKYIEMNEYLPGYPVFRT